MKIDKLRLTNRVRVLRAEADITQEELAKAVGVTRQTIVSIEGEEYEPSVLLALAIARYFKTPLESAFNVEARK